jgi:GlpG protein
MRIICTLNDKKKANILSSFLASEGIENQLEIDTNTDWGSSNYGDVSCKIWVYDEDLVFKAMRWVETFENDPDNPVFKKTTSQSIFSPPSPPPPVSSPEVRFTEKKIKPPFLKEPASSRLPKTLEQPLGTLTFLLILICCFLFIISEFTSPTLTSIPSNLPPTPLLSSPIYKSLYYDYPFAFELVDKLVKLYGVDRLQNLQDLPHEGQVILEKFLNTPYWKGFYEIFIHKLQNPHSKMIINAPLFEKIRQGEFWRLLTPCFLHSNLLHILFNMLWLVVLGKQMEERLSPSRYLILLTLIGIFSNTCQYLMGGANFIGFSGILCGMLTFIWMRKKIAPWEGYPLQKATISFMIFFILSMFSLQLISFYLEIKQQVSISPGIANTGHLSGAFIGIVLGCLPFFSWKS